MLLENHYLISDCNNRKPESIFFIEFDKEGPFLWACQLLGSRCAPRLIIGIIKRINGSQYIVNQYFLPLSDSVFKFDFSDFKKLTEEQFNSLYTSSDPGFSIILNPQNQQS